MLHFILETAPYRCCATRHRRNDGRHGHDAGAGGKEGASACARGSAEIDAATGRITLKHGPIANLGMSAMTMAFPVKDPTMLKGLKEGDQVPATFDSVGGKATVVDLRK